MERITSIDNLESESMNKWMDAVPKILQQASLEAERSQKMKAALKLHVTNKGAANCNLVIKYSIRFS